MIKQNNRELWYKPAYGWPKIIVDKPYTTWPGDRLRFMPKYVKPHKAFKITIRRLMNELRCEI